MGSERFDLTKLSIIEIKTRDKSSVIDEMYERFTERIQKVMALASQEARRLNHEYIGPEHILLGLLKEGSGVGLTVLANLDVDPKKLRKEINSTLEPGPDIVTMGKLPQTPIARKVIEYAIEYARALGHRYVGTEHLLYGLVAADEGLASQILAKQGIGNKERVRQGIECLLNAGASQQGTSQQAIEQTSYWRVPRSDLNLIRFLEVSGYKIGEIDGNPALIEHGEYLIGSINPPDYGSGTVIYHCPDKGQLQKALKLRGVFDLNNVRYTEEPPASEVAEELRKSAGTVEQTAKSERHLADELERKVEF